MAIYDRTYKAYDGPLTPSRTRFLIVPRYAFQGVFASKLFTAFFAACFLPSLIAAILIYLHHNLSALSLFQVRAQDLLAIDRSFFAGLLSIQELMLGFLLALIVGPGLVSRDLVHNALPLYLSRPFTRTEYVLGKTSVLAILLSAITWIPTLLLFLFQAYLEGGDWLAANGRIAPAVLVSSWTWILVLSLLTLALSATFKKKILAQAALFGFFFITAAFGELVNVMLHTRWGTMLALSQVFQVLQAALFGIQSEIDLPVWAACLSLLSACAICLHLLARKVRAHEVVR